jgi:WD40-like Beta Propeller Repeat
MKSKVSLTTYVVRSMFLIAATVLPFTAAALDLLSGPGTSFSLPASAGGDSYNQILSADGRYVVFTSSANNLARRSGGAPYILPVPLKLNAFLRDRVQGTTTLISADPTDAKSGEDDSIPTGISADGQYVLFETSSRISPDRDSTNRLNTSEVYLRDVINKTTTLVSVRTNAQFNLSARESVMTPDARYIAFSSSDPTFVPNDAKASDVFVRDMVQGVTLLASGGLPLSAHIDCFAPVITPDGKYVAFLGRLPSGNPTQDVYVCDLSTTNTFCVSTNSHRFFSGVPYCYGQEISQDGKYAAYQANANFGATTAFVFRHNIETGTDDVVSSNAVPVSTTQPLDMSPDGRFIAFVGKSSFSQTAVFLWDAQTGTNIVVTTYTIPPTGPVTIICESPSVDATGRLVTFVATGPDLVANADSSTPHIYRRDMQNPVLELVDVGTNGGATNRTFNSDYAMSADGRFIAFDSPDADLVTQDGNNASDVFVRDLSAETTELISASEPSLATQTAGRLDKRSGAHVSADGHLAVFIAGGRDLVPGHTNRFRQVFGRDLINQSNLVVSVDTNGLGNAHGSASECAISGDGRYVAFNSFADNLVPRDTNHFSDVFLRDLQTGTTTLVSSNAGFFSASGFSYPPAISLDGRYITYLSIAPVVQTFGNLAANLFVYDRVLRTNYLLTTNASFFSSTPDGRYVAFWGGIPQGGGVNIYVWDSLLNRRVFTNTSSIGTISSLAISTNGQRLAYVSSSASTSLRILDCPTRSNVMVSVASFGPRANMRFSGDGQALVYATVASNAPPDRNITSDVYVFDWLSQTNTLVSRSYLTGKAATGASDFPDISADGRYITYQSNAGDIVPLDSNGRLKDVFLFDRQSGSTMLLSASAYGLGTADYESQSPAFTADGQTVTFQSWASDITTNDFNQSSDLFLLKIINPFNSTNPVPVLTGQLILASNSGAVGAPLYNVQLTWPAAPGFGYQVQYKTNLTDVAWLPVNGSVVIQGGQGYVKDFLPDPDHRFYRIVGY